MPWKPRTEAQKALHRAANKRWKQMHRDKVIAQKRRRYAKHRDEIIDKNTAKARSHPQVKAAQMLAEKYIPLTGKACEECGTAKNLERHHPNYDEPLEVKILCKKDHQVKGSL